MYSAFVLVYEKVRATSALRNMLYGKADVPGSRRKPPWTIMNPSRVDETREPALSVVPKLQRHQAADDVA